MTSNVPLRWSGQRSRNMAVIQFLAPGIFVILALFFRNKPYVYPSTMSSSTSMYNLSNLDQFSSGSTAALTILFNLRSQRSAILKVRSGTQLRFLLILLLYCGDVELNPGPQWKYPCGICRKPDKQNQQGIQCDECQTWFHVKSNCYNITA